jgi:hypothetical protein
MSEALLLFLSKVDGAFYRVGYYVMHFPIRVRRLFNHLINLVKHPRMFLKWSKIGLWTIELFCYVWDLIGLGEVYEILMDFIKFNTRPLRDNEKELARRVFGDLIKVHRVRIDEYAFIRTRHSRFAYVSFYTINCWGQMDEDMFLHELTHIWHYQNLGSAYIPRSLSAQFSEDGYNYGGLANLVLAIRTGRGLDHFNLEQQGDILADYHRISQGRNPRWGNSSDEDIWVYEHLLNDLKEKAMASV